MRGGEGNSQPIGGVGGGRSGPQPEVDPPNANRHDDFIFGVAEVQLNF